METTPEQQLATVWALSSPIASTAPNLPRQGPQSRQRTPVAQQSKFRKGVGKGAGKAMPYAKRTREQEEEEELWMDSELDEATIRRTLRTLIGAAARHEQQLTSLEADRSYVLFLETGNHGMINMLIQASQAWHQQYEAGTVTTTLRATLWGVLLLEWQARLTKIEQDTQALQTAETANWILRTPLQWVYTEWNAEQKKALPSSKDNLSHEQTKQAVANLLRNTAKDAKCIGSKADVVVMLLTLTIHQHAAEVYRDLDLLANNCAGKVIGLRLRKERVNKTSLAKELEKLQL
ncbi:pksN [Symbiodinium pilosum]|uniref:PksN protein n=1 Tax=Symbiodinium pilosum TaxID=2952 RepID=A0A812NXL9_SYMPI|nr:pksN [Symbiodinium pilosum]